MAFRSRIWIKALILLAAWDAWAQAGQEPSVEVYVYNRAGVSFEILSQAEQDATRIFRVSGVRTTWVECSTAEAAGTNCRGLPRPGDIVLQIVHETRELKADVFGAAFLGQDGTGEYTNVFYDRVNELNRDWKVPLAEVLGHVIAHEVGHLLLGLNSHAASGIMRGYWESGELKAVQRGRLLFSSGQSKVMRERLAAITSHRNAQKTLALGLSGN